MQWHYENAHFTLTREGFSCSSQRPARGRWLARVARHRMLETHLPAAARPRAPEGRWKTMLQLLFSRRIDHAVDASSPSRARKRKRHPEGHGSFSSAWAARRSPPHMWESQANMPFPSPLHHRAVVLVTASCRSTTRWALSTTPPAAPEPSLLGPRHGSRPPTTSEVGGFPTPWGPGFGPSSTSSSSSISVRTRPPAHAPHTAALVPSSTY